MINGLGLFYLILLFFFLGQLLNANADILFIDTNNTPEEVAAARAGAEARGEKLVLFPTRTPEQQEILDQIHKIELQKERIRKPVYAAYRKMDAARRQLEREKSSQSPNPKRVETLTNEMNTFNQKMLQANKDTKAEVQKLVDKQIALQNKVVIRKEDLQKFIASYQNRAEKITSIVFSGHHDFEKYSGYLGVLDKADVTEAFKKNPSLMKEVRSIYGWGCYSATVAEIEWWSREFKGLQLIGGYDAGAPSTAQKANLDWLTGVLSSEARIRKVLENKKAEEKIKVLAKTAAEIPGFQITNAAICSTDVCVGKNIGKIELAKQEVLCNEEHLNKIKEVSKKIPEVLGVVVEASGNCRNAFESIKSNIPCETGAKSWLRQHYNYLQNHRHCGEKLGRLMNEFKFFTAHSTRFIRLIDFKGVFERFQNLYQDDLRRLSQLDKKCKLEIPSLQGEIRCTPPPEENPVTPKIERKKLLEFISRFDQNTCLKPTTHTKGGFWGLLKSDQNQNQISKSEYELILKMNKRFNRIVKDLDCIPLSWLHPLAAGHAIESPPRQCGL